MPIARSFIEAEHLSERITVESRNILESDVEDRFDCALLSAVIQVLPPVAKCTKTNGLKMYQGQFWANFRRGDAEKGSAPEAGVRPLLAGWGSAPHRPPEYKASC